ncbi:MAG: hypothetical protein KDI56_10045 [Xanthomonadales bacterium]|nr:hypothetical protein [Xanthomonadales bacterium]
MPTIRVELTAMDKRICPLCSGAGWYYVDVPGRKPIPAVLKQCPRTMMHQNYAYETSEPEAMAA